MFAFIDVVFMVYQMYLMSFQKKKELAAAQISFL